MAFGLNVYAVAFGTIFLAFSQALHAEDPLEVVRQAVNSELNAARVDHSHWRYHKQAGGGNELIVVETSQGAVSRHIKENGAPVSDAMRQADDAAVQRFIHDPSLQAKQKRDGEHDDKDAAELLNLLPTAFLWKIESETPELVHLSYRPNPEFSPPDMESRVMGNMRGTMIVFKDGHRIQSFKGTLENDVTIGFGLLARLKQGGTFDVERRQLPNGAWQITETHVHIGGRASCFIASNAQGEAVRATSNLSANWASAEDASAGSCWNSSRG
jgi:hypothetical protein